MVVEIASAIVVVSIAVLVGTQRKKERDRVPNRRATDPLEAGEPVRFLCAIPEQKIEAGDTGRIVLIYPGDDREYWVVPDRDVKRRVKFFDYELWQLERL